MQQRARGSAASAANIYPVRRVSRRLVAELPSLAPVAMVEGLRRDSARACLAAIGLIIGLCQPALSERPPLSIANLGLNNRHAVVSPAVTHYVALGVRRRPPSAAAAAATAGKHR